MQQKDLAANLVQQATTYINEKKFDKAVTMFTEAITLDGSNAEAFYRLSNIQADQAQLADAITNYEKAIAINPSYAMFNPQKKRLAIL